MTKKINYYKNQLSNEVESHFLKQLNYWTQRGQYGIEKNGRIWIYNSLDSWATQLKVSKSTIQRTIRSLKGQGIIDSEYLSHSKRNRTLFYSINYEKLAISEFSHMVKIKAKIPADDHMVDHMYYIDNNNKFNKSYKSLNNFSEKSSEGLSREVADSETSNLEFVVDEKSKNTTVQDMVKIFNTEFSDISVKLDKSLARNLVAAFKMKFEGSLEKWREFLKLIKTSSYLMGEKFKLTLLWLLKFSTIDRLKLGELGVKIKSFFTTEIPDDEWNSMAEQQIEETDEPVEIKAIRREIVKKITAAKYMAWFKNVKFLQKNETIELIYPNRFTEDNIKLKFSENFNFIGF